MSTLVCMLIQIKQLHLATFIKTFLYLDETIRDAEFIIITTLDLQYFVLVVLIQYNIKLKKNQVLYSIQYKCEGSIQFDTRGPNGRQ